MLMAYSSSLTDAEWVILERLLPKLLPHRHQTRPLEWSYRELIDGILYRLKNGCNWADLPKDLPPYSTVYWHYKQWREAGTWDHLMTIVHERVRVQVQKQPQWTSLIMIDSQAVKNTCNASVETKGFCFYKQRMALNDTSPWIVWAFLSLLTAPRPTSPTMRV